MKRLLIISILFSLSAYIMSILYREATANYWSTDLSKSEESTLDMNDLVFHSENSTRPKSSTDRDFKFQLSQTDQMEFFESSVWKWRVVNDHLWIVGGTTQSFYQLDQQGELIFQWGTIGGAPWENQEIASFNIFDNQFYIVDRDKREVKIVGRNNEVTYYKKLDLAFWSGSFLGHQKMVIISESGTDYSFQIRSISNNEAITKHINMTEILRLDAPTAHMNIAYEGYFISNSKDAIYVSLKAGKFFIVDADNEEVRAYSTIDETEAPKISIRKLGGLNIFLRDPDHNVNYSACADSDYLYILSTILFQRKDELNLDIYRISDGSYIGSASIPNFEEQLPTDITKPERGNTLYVLYEDQAIVKYNIDVKK